MKKTGPEESRRDIAEAASEALKVVANAAAEALKITNSNNSNDHDLIIKLDTKMDSLKDDIKSLAEGTNTKINDHEARLRVIEKESEDHILVKKVVYGAVSFILTAVLGAIVFLVIKE